MYVIANAMSVQCCNSGDICYQELPQQTILTPPYFQSQLGISLNSLFVLVTTEAIFENTTIWS